MSFCHVRISGDVIHKFVYMFLRTWMVLESTGVGGCAARPCRSCVPVCHVRMLYMFCLCPYLSCAHVCLHLLCMCPWADQLRHNISVFLFLHCRGIFIFLFVLQTCPAPTQLRLHLPQRNLSCAAINLQLLSNIRSLVVAEQHEGA
eukprot:GHVS01075513.1.p1 GENE.GHVS01075513.1~~GHVS01075513.1.p1  ORF type:complete len:169 (-),score=12.76 GHVS01075513.1:270-707(-)